MPKQKTHKGLAKRVKITGTGKIKRMRAGGGHLMSHKSGKQCRVIGRASTMNTRMTHKTRQLLNA